MGIGGEKEGNIGASTDELEAGRRRVTLAEMTSASERAQPCGSQLNDAAIGTPSLASVNSTPARLVRRQSSPIVATICR